MKSEMSNVPKLRFSEFVQAPFFKKELSSLLESISTGVSVNSYDYPVIGSALGVLKTSCIYNGQFIPSENKTIIEADIPRAKNFIQKDSILVSRMNTPELVGEVGYVSENYRNLFVPDRLWVLKNNSSIITNWLVYYFISPNTKFAIKQLGTGTSNSMKNISQKDFLMLNIYFPNSQEQQKIADFLSTVDKKLQTLKQKQQLLQQYKKGMMQKLFSQQIRFKDEDGRGYPRRHTYKIGQIVKNLGGTPLEKYRDDSSKYHFISIGNYTVDGKYYDNGQKIELNDITNKKLLNKNDLVMVLNDKTSAGYIIGSTILIPEDDKYIYNQRSERLILNKDVVPVYLWFYLNSPIMRNKIFSLSQGGTQIYINFSVIKELSIDLPSNKEQQKIADFLSAIDKKIDLITQQIAHTEQFKKGLLQQLFV